MRTGMGVPGAESAGTCTRYRRAPPSRVRVPSRDPGRAASSTEAAIAGPASNSISATAAAVRWHRGLSTGRGWPARMPSVYAAGRTGPRLERVATRPGACASGSGSWGSDAPRRVGPHGLLVHVGAPPGTRGQDQVPVLDLRLFGDEVVVPGNHVG